VLDQENAAARTGTTVKVDRRRPGRIEDISPELIPLLRGMAKSSELSTVADAAPPMTEHDLLPATGIVLGTLFGALLWGAVWGCYTLLH
jgi:hypothetical protein